MPERQLKLAKPWGGHPAGTLLTVHQGDDPITPTTVDPKRAVALVTAKLAAAVVDAAKAAVPVSIGRKED